MTFLVLEDAVIGIILELLYYNAVSFVVICKPDYAKQLSPAETKQQCMDPVQ